MIFGQILTALLCSLTSLCYVLSMDEPVITRDTYDLLHYPNCDETRAENFNCDEIAAERYGDLRLCRCKCKNGYLAYRDPAVEYNNTRRTYDFSKGTRKCVWHGLYREGCHFLRLGRKLGPFHAPTILDLTTSGNIVLTRESVLSPQQAFCVQPFVHIPGENRWKKIEDIIFNLVPANAEKSSYILSWSLQSETNIYAYQGLVIKLNFSECFQPIVFCLIAKAAGTYTGDDNCERRAVSGRCCIFPFVHNDVVYNDCASTPDMPGGKWCAVSLNNSVDEGNHKWRELCSTTSTTTSSETTRPLSRRPPIFHTPPPKRRRKTTSRQSTTQPHRGQQPGKNKNSAGIITVTVTHQTCGSSNTRAVPTAGPGKGSGDSRVHVGMIVGILLGILVFLVILVLLVLYLRRKKTTKKRRVRPKKSVSRQDLAESSYASIYSTMSARERTRSHLNHGYQQSIELSKDEAAVVRRSYLRDSRTSSNSHFYDSIENKSPPNTQSSYPIYSMPEADYSLIIGKRQTKIDKAPDLPPVLPVMLSNKKKNPNKHLYSVLERSNDPLKNPEPTDNDTVFVEANPIYASSPRYKQSEEPNAESEGGYAEANPLYGTTPRFNRNNPPPLPPRLYDDPMEILPSKSEPPGTNEKDV